MNKFAIIGGSRFISLERFSITHATTMSTPFGAPSAPLNYGVLGEREVVLLPRRSSDFPLPPHQVNYRANIWALRDAGVKTILAASAVAGLSDYFSVGDMVLPDQLIDYTFGRENTFYGEDIDNKNNSVDFSEPYSESLRQELVTQAEMLGITLNHPATYGITQGPRFETMAELKKITNDGCHLVGMTGMPEASLARELGLEYAAIGIVVKKAGNHNRTDSDKAKITEAENQLAKLIEAFIIASRPN